MQIVNRIRRLCVKEGILIYDQTVIGGQWWRFKVHTSNFSVPITMPFTDANIEAVMEQMRLASKDNV